MYIYNFKNIIITTVLTILLGLIGEMFYEFTKNATAAALGSEGHYVKNYGRQVFFNNFQNLDLNL